MTSNQRKESPSSSERESGSDDDEDGIQRDSSSRTRSTVASAAARANPMARLTSSLSTPSMAATGSSGIAASANSKKGRDMDLFEIANPSLDASSNMTESLSPQG